MEDIIAIDGTGRLVVPKPLRTRLGLRAGTRLRVRDEEGRLVIEPIAEHAAPMEAHGLLVIRGHLVGEIPDHRTTRTRRMRSFVPRP